MKMSEVVGGIGDKKSNNGTQYYQQDRVYSVADIAQCIPAQIPGGAYRIMNIVAIDEQNMLTREETIGTLTTDGSSPKHNNRICEITRCVAERTRCQGEWIKGEKHEGKLEMREDECTNTITSVTKDNEVLLIRQATKEGTVPCKIGGVADLNYVSNKTRRGRVIQNGEICPTLTTENIPSVLEPWIWEIDGVKYLIRIRKLTPRECWRLMDFN